MSLIGSRQPSFLSEQDTARIQSPTRYSFSGIGDLSVRVTHRSRFKPVYIRLHLKTQYQHDAPLLPVFSDFNITLDSSAGDEHDTLLYSVSQRGYGRDMHLQFTKEELADPSPWTFESDDALTLEWLNPDSLLWGLQVGITSL